MEARGRISLEVRLKQPPNLPAAMDEAGPFPHTQGSQGGGLTHLQQTLPTRSSPALLPAPGWQQWFFLAFLPLDRDKEGAQGKISSIPPAIACQETGAPAGSPS